MTARERHSSPKTVEQLRRSANPFRPDSRPQSKMPPDCIGAKANLADLPGLMPKLPRPTTPPAKIHAEMLPVKRADNREEKILSRRALGKPFVCYFLFRGGFDDFNTSRLCI